MKSFTIAAATMALASLTLAAPSGPSSRRASPLSARQSCGTDGSVLVDFFGADNTTPLWTETVCLTSSYELSSVCADDSADDQFVGNAISYITVNVPDSYHTTATCEITSTDSGKGVVPESMYFSSGEYAVSVGPPQIITEIGCVFTD